MFPPELLEKLKQEEKARMKTSYGRYRYRLANWDQHARNQLDFS